MAGRIGYGVYSAVAIVLTIGVALGQGMQMQPFTSEEAAQQHCPADTVVWFNPKNANYVLKGDRWYARTTRGNYVCKAEADKAGVPAAARP
jgi:hypothetical protein